MSILSSPLQDIFIKSRTLGPIQVQVVVSEQTTDTLTITKQPVQQGASISDHAYMEPTTFSCSIFQQQTSNLIGIVTQTLAQIYQSFIELQQSLKPFNIITPKRTYKSMLMTQLSMTTDKNTENILSLQLSFQQVIIVPVQTAIVVRSQLKTPASNSPTQQTGPKQSALEDFHQGIVGLRQ